MNNRTRSGAAVLVALATATVALGANLQGCELITDFDRSLIPDAGGEDASDLHVETPPFTFDAAADASVPPTADSGSDAGDATVTDAATDAGDAESTDAADASDASDAAGDDGGDADAG